MVILAVNIISYSSAKRDKLRSGSDRQEISGRNYKLQNIRKAYSGLGDKNSRCSIKADEMVEAGHIDHRAAIVDTAISV
jgi:hypothetical protein